MPEPPPKAVEEVEAPPATVSKWEKKVPEPAKGTNLTGTFLVVSKKANMHHLKCHYTGLKICTHEFNLVSLIFFTISLSCSIG